MKGVAGGEMRFVLRPRSDSLPLLLLVYALPLLACLYGLKCAVAQEGRLPVSKMFAPRHSFSLRTVRGGSAMLAGLG